MRYGPEHKAETHRKIVQDASRRVRVEGMSGAAVAAVMQDAGLTHGGFYKHFESKDDLLAESLGEAFGEIAGRFTRVAEKAPRGTGWKAIVRAYLSVEHVDHPELGCPLAALAPELARMGAGAKKRVLGAMGEYGDRLLPYMPGRRRADKEQAFVALIATMSGAVALARILPDRAGRERVLRTAREFLLRSF